MYSEYFATLLDQHEGEIDRVIQARGRSATTAFEPRDGQSRSYLFDDEWEESFIQCLLQTF